ncbi:tubulin polyglutamylase ttll5 [Plakobranchus ocellatus]|uniref:Tubulin polyglutamylase ttll5 n=1 Tax=Plakobranchus ocellatus TaxID=259542 RepID=A0AAV4DXK1_9GAST|nr:tubulin polyglutamylase ttll5 [Plakobranchus ocellatus]
MECQTVFRINDNGVGPELLTQVFLERGWVEYDEEHHGEHGWHLWWRTTRFRTSEYSGLLPWQRINHFPSCGAITRKDALCRNFRKMRIVHGQNVYSFSPQAYNLPNDYTKFVSEYATLRNQTSKRQTGRDNSGGLAGKAHDNRRNPQLSQGQTNQPQETPTPLMWICKPAESSRGRGIFIFQDLSELQYDCNAVVQQYISDPLLIGGYKFDIRVYVAVPSFSPLQIYIHEEGLVRFSTEKYDLDRPDNVFAHLTNTSINKFSPGYTTDKEEVGHGCKWTISQLRRYFLQNSINDGPLWHKVTNIIILTMLMQAPSAPKIPNCFELYGFDILVDSQLKPWLLEVNVGPALSSDCQADLLAKKSMLHDLLDLVFVDPAAGDTNLPEGGGGVGGLNLGRDFTMYEDLPKSAALSQGFDSQGAGGVSRTLTGLGSLENLTDRTLTSLHSPLRSHRSSTTNKATRHNLSPISRPSDSVQSFDNNSTTDRRYSDSGALQKSTIINVSNNNNFQQHHNPRLRDEGLKNSDRRRSLRADSPYGGRKIRGDSPYRRRSLRILTPVNVKSNNRNELYHADAGIRGAISGVSPPPAVANDVRYGEPSLRKIGLENDAKNFLGERNLDNIQFNSVQNSSAEKGYGSNDILPAASDKTVRDCQVNENCIQTAESKTSNTSDSGISSLSLSSGENSQVPAVATPIHSKQRTEIGQSEHQTQDSTEDASHRVGADLIRRLSELPAKSELEKEHLVYAREASVGAENEAGEADGMDLRPVMVHGNMKRRGMRRLLVPSLDRSISRSSPNNDNSYNHKLSTNSVHKITNSNNSSVSAPSLQRRAQGGSNSSLNTVASLGKGSTGTKMPADARHNVKVGNSLNNMSARTTASTAASTASSNSVSRRQSQRQLQQRQTHYAHPADERQARMYAIPRNFSRTEAARFPHSYHHGRHPYVDSNNNNHPVITPRKASKKVGRLFLVFPFSEATQKLTHGKLDPKLVIKEIQKHLRENIKHSSISIEHDVAKERRGENAEPYIWAPLKSSDNFDF